MVSTHPFRGAQTAHEHMTNAVHRAKNTPCRCVGHACRARTASEHPSQERLKHDACMASARETRNTHFATTYNTGVQRVGAVSLGYKRPETAIRMIAVHNEQSYVEVHLGACRFERSVRAAVRSSALRSCPHADTTHNTRQNNTSQSALQSKRAYTLPGEYYSCVITVKRARQSA